MTEWGVYGVIVSVVLFIIALVTPIIKFNTVITKLSVVVDNLSKLLDKNEACHTTFTAQIAEHETRLTVIEKTKGAE